MTKRNLLLLLFVVIFTTNCKEKFEPPVTKTDLSALVVDGFINNSSDTTFIHLSRTKKLTEGILNSQENNAQLSIEDASGNTVYHFQKLNDSGIYIIPLINLSVNNKYRLRIITVNGKQYISDEMPVIKTPPIDSITWKKNGKWLDVDANTHDPLNKTIYYRYQYIETWQYHAAFVSAIKWLNPGFADRKPDELIYECWRTQPSTQLLLASSARLAEDIIYHNTLRRIDLDAVELSIKYFFSLKQYALTKEAFEYLENLKKITEQTGTIFDAQPVQVKGNIHAVDNPDETVLGYMTVSTEETKELYITNAEVQPWNYRPDCLIFKVDSANFKNTFSDKGIIPLNRIMRGFDIIGANSATYECADCRALGGVTTKPGFWP